MQDKTPASVSYTHLDVYKRQEGGATAVAYNKISWNPKYQVINNLDYEVTQFLQKDGFKPDDLVILWVGANDYLAYGWNTEQDAKRVRDAISDAANRMVLNLSLIHILWESALIMCSKPRTSLPLTRSSSPLPLVWGVDEQAERNSRAHSSPKKRPIRSSNRAVGPPVTDWPEPGLVSPCGILTTQGDAGPLTRSPLTGWEGCNRRSGLHPRRTDS